MENAKKGNLPNLLFNCQTTKNFISLLENCVYFSPVDLGSFMLDRLIYFSTVNRYERANNYIILFLNNYLRKCALIKCLPTKKDFYTYLSKSLQIMIMNDRKSTPVRRIQEIQIQIDDYLLLETDD